jgi:benzoyl-CoA reductase/2-hydroxyglutaryl-CoA dehydratase subunit BcrC/BadD/HgdB
MQIENISTKAIDNIINIYSTHHEYQKKSGKNPSAEFFLKVMLDIYSDAAMARQNGKISTLSAIYGPEELFLANDVAYLKLEDFCGALGSIGSIIPFLEASEGRGFPKESCSCAGVTNGLSVTRMLPKADFITNVGYLCDSCELPNMNLKYNYGIPDYMIDSGYGSRSEESVAYYKRRLMEFVPYMEAFTGKKMDQVRFEEIMKHSRKAFHHYFEMNKLRVATPLPISAREQIKDYSLMLNGSGREDVSRYMAWHHQQVQERVDKGMGVIPEEKHRMFWIGCYPFFDLKITDWLAKEHGTVVVGDFFDSYCFNAKGGSWYEKVTDPYEFLARKALNYPAARFCQQFEDYMPDIVEFCKQANVDTAAFYGSFGCKNVGLVRRAWMDRLREECGMKTVWIDGDILDPRVNSIAGIQSQFNDFFSVLGHK